MIADVQGKVFRSRICRALLLSTLLLQAWVGEIHGTDRERPVRRAGSLDLSGDHNVRAFGAVGDGVSDDSTAIQEAIDSLPGTTYPGGKVYFPPGKYLVKSTIWIRRGVTIEGANRRNTSIIGDFGVKAVIARDPRRDTGEQDVTLRQIGFRPLDPFAIAIDFSGITQSKIEDVFISTWTPEGLYPLQSDATVGIRFAAGPRTSCYSNSVRDVRMEGIGVGIHVLDAANLQIIDHVDFGAKWGLWIEGPRLAHIVVQNSRFDAMGGGAALIVGDVQSVTFSSSYFERLPVGIRVVAPTAVPNLTDNYVASTVNEFLSEVTPEDVWLVRLLSDAPNVVRVGEGAAYRAEVKGGAGKALLYRFSAINPSQNDWAVIRDFSSDPRVLYISSLSGIHRLAVTVVEASDPSRVLASTTIPLRVLEGS